MTFEVVCVCVCVHMHILQHGSAAGSMLPGASSVLQPLLSTGQPAATSSTLSLLYHCSCLILSLLVLALQLPHALPTVLVLQLPHPLPTVLALQLPQPLSTVLVLQPPHTLPTVLVQRLPHRPQRWLLLCSA